MTAPLNQAFPLSTSPYGAPIALTATTHPAQLVHTADLTAYDFVVLWVNNATPNDIDITTVVVPSGSSNTSSPIATVITVPAKSGKTVVEPGVLLTGGYQLQAFASAAGLTLMGYVYRRTQS